MQYIGREASLERDEILKGLSSLTFHEKQRDLLDKHHQGTGQWMLHSEEFQRWFNGQENSTLWCYGMRKDFFRLKLQLSIRISC